MTNPIKLSIKYVLLVLILSLPFFLLGIFNGLTQTSLIRLPLSAFMFICPAIALLIVDKEHFKKEVFNVFDFQKIKNFIWVIATIFLPTLLMTITFQVMKFIGVQLPELNIKILDTLLLFVLFFSAATFEELGWTGYLTKKLLTQNSILKTGIYIGLFWAIWHIIPYFQNGKSLSWIFWQCITTVLFRILMVWIFVRGGTSLFLAILFHTMINIVELSFPRMGSHYAPFYFAMTVLPVTLIILMLDRKNASH